MNMQTIIVCLLKQHTKKEYKMTSLRQAYLTMYNVADKYTATISPNFTYEIYNTSGNLTKRMTKAEIFAEQLSNVWYRKFHVAGELNRSPNFLGSGMYEEGI